MEADGKEEEEEEEHHDSIRDDRHTQQKRKARVRFAKTIQRDCILVLVDSCSEKTTRKPTRHTGDAWMNRERVEEDVEANVVDADETDVD